MLGNFDTIQKRGDNAEHRDDFFFFTYIDNIFEFLKYHS